MGENNRSLLSQSHTQSQIFVIISLYLFSFKYCFLLQICNGHCMMKDKKEVVTWKEAGKGCVFRVAMLHLKTKLDTQYYIILDVKVL